MVEINRLDVPEWFGFGLEGVDCADWLPYLTAVELGLDRPKLTIDFATDEEYISYPAGWAFDTIDAAGIEAA